MLILADYEGKSMSNLGIGDVRSPGEPSSHMEKLLQDISLHGIKQPVVVVAHNSTLYLLDGHHRAVLAYRLGVFLPALLMECGCASPFCDYALELAQFEHRKTQLAGWEWRAEHP